MTSQIPPDVIEDISEQYVHFLLQWFFVLNCYLRIRTNVRLVFSMIRISHVHKKAWIVHGLRKLYYSHLGSRRYVYCRGAWCSLSVEASGDEGRRLSTYGKDGRDPVSNIPTFPAVLSYDRPQSPVVYLFLVVGGREFNRDGIPKYPWSQNRYLTPLGFIVNLFGEPAPHLYPSALTGPVQRICHLSGKQR